VGGQSFKVFERSVVGMAENERGGFFGCGSEWIWIIIIIVVILLIFPGIFRQNDGYYKE